MKIKEIKIREDDGSYSDAIPVGVDAINADMSDGISVEKAITDLRGGVSNLDNAIESLNIKTDALSNGSPLAAKSVNEMTDTSKIYVNTTDGYWYYYNGSSWISGGIYQSTQIANDSIIVEKMIKSLQSDNKFNYDTITEGKIIDHTGSFIENLEFYTSDYIPVKANQTYYVNYCRIISYFNNAKEFIKRDDLIGTDLLHEFTPEQDGYIRTSHHNSTKGIIFVSEINHKTDNYSVNGFIENTENLKFLTKHKNLINYNNVQLFKVTNIETGEISDNPLFCVVDIEIPTPTNIYYNFIRSGIYLNSNKEYIGKISYAYNTELIEKYVSSHDIKYVRLNIYLYDLTKAYFSYNKILNTESQIFGKYLPNDLKVTKENIIDKFFGKTLYAFGDSILAGHLSNISCIDTFCVEKKINYTKYAKNGATIVNGSNSIIEQINNASSKIPNYVLFNGLTNDAYSTTIVGTITENFDSELDLTTFCGCFENICRTLINKYHSAKICYIAVHKMPTRDKNVQFNLQNLAHQICNKYSLPIIDVFNEGNLNTYNETMRSLYSYTTLDKNNIISGGSGGGGTHPNTLGYKLFYDPLIEKIL